jgi:uncharacterized protein (TIGR02594 family)
MQFNSIKTASLGAFAIAILGSTALSGTAQARPVAGGEWNNGFGRYYGADPSGWNWNEPAGPRKRKSARHERVSREQARHERVSRRHARQIRAETSADAGYPSRVDDRFPDSRSTYALQDAGSAYAMQTQEPGRRSRRAAPQRAVQMTAGFGGGDLVSEARRYIGGNPTGRSSLWCGAFMDLILQRTGHRPGSNLARDYASYGTRVSGPQVGAIAVMSRGKRGGHVGVVSGIDESGNPIIISGNHGRRVAESTYSRGRVYAYVMP